jgi:hypothetical protein
MPLQSAFQSGGSRHPHGPQDGGRLPFPRGPEPLALPLPTAQGASFLGLLLCGRTLDLRKWCWSWGLPCGGDGACDPPGGAGAPPARGVGPSLFVPLPSSAASAPPGPSPSSDSSSAARLPSFLSPSSPLAASPNFTVILRRERRGAVRGAGRSLPPASQHGGRCLFQRRPPARRGPHRAGPGPYPGPSGLPRPARAASQGRPPPRPANRVSAAGRRRSGSAALPAGFQPRLSLRGPAVPPPTPWGRGSWPSLRPPRSRAAQGRPASLAARPLRPRRAGSRCAPAPRNGPRCRGAPSTRRTEARPVAREPRGTGPPLPPKLALRATGSTLREPSRAGDAGCCGKCQLKRLCNKEPVAWNRLGTPGKVTAQFSLQKTEQNCVHNLGNNKILA